MQKQPEVGGDASSRMNHHYLLSLLPARFNDPREQPLVGHLTQLVAAQSKITVVPARPSRFPTAIAQTSARASTRQLLDLAVNRELFARIFGLPEFFQQCLTLFSVLSNKFFALALPLNHAFFSHAMPVVLLFLTQSLMVAQSIAIRKPPDQVNSNPHLEKLAARPELVEGPHRLA
jgi:hypothetical protein